MRKKKEESGETFAEKEPNHYHDTGGIDRGGRVSELFGEAVREVRSEDRRDDGRSGEQRAFGYIRRGYGGRKQGH